MDPATLAAEAVAFVTPYLLDFAKNLGSDAASDGAKSVWAWIKGKLATDHGRVVTDAETAPKEPDNIQFLQATLTRALKADPAAAEALAALLKKSGASLTQTSNVTGNGNTVVQASGSTVNVR